MEVFELYRNGEGEPALEGMVFGDGTTVVRWRRSRSTTMFESYDAFLNVHVTPHPDYHSVLRKREVDDVKMDDERNVTLDVLAQGHLFERTYVLSEEVKDVFVEYMREQGMGRRKGDAYIWSRKDGDERSWYLTIPGV